MPKTGNAHCFRGFLRATRNNRALGMMAQIVQARAGSLLLPAQLIAQRRESMADLPIGQRLGLCLEEERRAATFAKGFGASLKVRDKARLALGDKGT